MREGRDRVVTLATDRTGKILACHVSNGEGSAVELQKRLMETLDNICKCQPKALHASDCLPCL